MTTALLLLAVGSALAAAPTPAVTYAAAAGRVEVRGLSPAADPNAVRLFVEGAADPVLGTTGVTDGVVWFRPRFPLAPGVRYRAAVGSGVGAVIELPRPAPAVLTRVAAVYPSSDVLPENLLRLYLQFSAPVRTGEVSRRVRLLDAAGKPVADPFLELDDELWDPAGTRLTLLLDPGRVKRGLKPRHDAGPVLEAGKSYTLTIDAGWPDAAGRPLAVAFRKSFRVGPAANGRLDPCGWTVAAPARPTDPVEVRFSRPLDRGLLDRGFAVTGPDGTPVAGTGEPTAAELGWRFRPTRPWAVGEHRLRPNPDLEDPAGNRLDRPFDADLSAPPAARPAAAEMRFLAPASRR